MDIPSGWLLSAVSSFLELCLLVKVSVICFPDSNKNVEKQERGPAMGFRPCFGIIHCTRWPLLFSITPRP